MYVCIYKSVVLYVCHIYRQMCLVTMHTLIKSSVACRLELKGLRTVCVKSACIDYESKFIIQCCVPKITVIHDLPAFEMTHNYFIRVNLYT